MGPVALLWLVAACEQQPQQMEIKNWELEAAHQRASVALADGKLSVAEKELRKVLESDGSHLGALTKLGRTLAARADREPGLAKELRADALRWFERALKQDPQSQVVWSELAQVARKAGDHARAMAALQKLQGLTGPTEASFKSMAELQVAMNKPAEAEALLRRAVEQGHDYGELRLALGRMLLEAGRVGDAREVLEAVEACPPAKDDLKRPPGCPTSAYYEAQDELGALAVRQGRLSEARAIYAKLVVMFPEDYMVWEILAALDETEGKWAAAEDKYRKSLEVDRVHPSVWRGLGRALTAQGRQEEARYAFRKADSFLAKSPGQALELADELVKLGEGGWARGVLERARILAQDQPELLANIQARLKVLSADQPAPEQNPGPPEGQP
jgi:tetratricopeptide (TPR) repeat protein